MSAPTLTFTNERTGLAVELGGNDLPETAIRWGGRVRREVQRYIGTDRVSVQVMGTVDQPITLSGVLDDQFRGNSRGGALAKRLELESLVYSGDLVRLEYNADQRWGFLDCTFDEETPERILYELQFEPLFRERPRPVKLKLARAPRDAATELDEAFEQLAARARDEPDELEPATATFVLERLDAAENNLASVVGALDGVLYFADLTAETARRVRRSLAGAMRRIVDVQRQLKSSASDTVSTVGGTGELLASIWRDEVLAETNRTGAAALSFFLELGAVADPSSSSSRTHTVLEGQSLESLALLYYGDFTLWTLIADANDLEFDQVDAGDDLVIPPEPAS